MQARKESGVTVRDTGLDVAFPDGSSAYFNYFWLRDNCRTSFNDVTRERTFDIFAEATAPEPLEIRLSDAVLDIVWHGGHNSRSIFLRPMRPVSLGMIRRTCRAGPGSAIIIRMYPATPSRLSWPTRTSGRPGSRRS